MAKPQVVIRMGSHAEKEYLEKTIKFFDGLILGANLVEATPGATASLLIKFGGKRLGVPFYLDPMTYAYGMYVDPDGRLRSDLDWIKSEQKTKKGIRRLFKRSYRNLAESLGGAFVDALANGAAITPSDFTSRAKAAAFCKSVVDYQVERLARVFQQDPEYKNFAAELPVPSAVFAPYFYIVPSDQEDWTRLNLRLAGLTAELGSEIPVHAVVVADKESLEDADTMRSLAKELPKTGVQGVWFWFSRFDEHRASASSLIALRSLVRNISEAGLSVFTMHGGYFSLALSKSGLMGTSHGVGYGEQKDVMPVIGQSTPTVRYHLPGIHKRVGVAEVIRCFQPLGITTAQEFYDGVCNCTICKGVVNKDLDDFEAFGDMHYSTPKSKRLAQTPAAAKRCRFHFLLSRLRERDRIAAATPDEIVKQLGAARRKWGRFDWIEDSCAHLVEWESALAY